MGWTIHPKQYKDKHGRVQLYYRILSKEGQIRKVIPNIKIKPEYFNKRTNQVNAKTESATVINEILTHTTNLLNKGWNQYESGNYTWDELKSYLVGAKADLDLDTFINTILKDEHTDNVFKTIKETFGSAKKYLQRELTFKDLNLNTTDKLIKAWNNSLRSATVKTYKYHWGLIVNSAHSKKYTPYQYESLKKWKIKKDKLSVKGNPYVETAKPEDFLNAVDRCTNLMHINGLGFWLLSFGMRGMYFTDFNVLHKRVFDITIDHDEYGDAAIIKHTRNKTDEPMWILVSYPFDQLQRKLRGYLEYTHGEGKHYKTKKLLRKTEENYLSYKESNGWFFKEYNKARWNTISKQCEKIGFPSFKSARKTFETVALTLEVSQETRDRLLGHEVKGVKKSYQDWEWDDLQEKVHKAHMEVLEKFNVVKLYIAFIKKANEILEKMYIDTNEFNDKYKC